MKVRRVPKNRAGALPALAEAFREHGFEGASLTLLSEATGLGKGSLYNFFPGGKEEMMDAVLAEIDGWFTTEIFSPLENAENQSAAITSMIEEVTEYFQAGGRICLVGCIGLNSSGEAFATKVRSYFARWISALAGCLEAGNVPASQAAILAEDVISSIQGAIVLAQAMKDKDIFKRIINSKRSLMLNVIQQNTI